MRKIIVVLILLAALSACDIFQLRDSEEPLKDPLWNDFAASVTDAFKNIEYAYEDSRNAVKYTFLFMQDYRFYFAAQDLSDYGINPEWTQAQEQDMIFNLHQVYSDISVDWQTLDTPDEISSSEARLYRAYTITGKPGTGETRILAKGNLELQYRRVNGYWYIFKWYDYRSGPEPTWGLLKHENL